MANTNKSQLGDWFESKPSSETKDKWQSTSAPLSSLPRILVLDGGVSTYLEHMITSSKKEEDDNSNNNDNNGNSSSSPFHYKNLWSSSLLLTTQGQKLIQSCHETFLYRSGSDMISTVTYQCHYTSLMTMRDDDSFVDLEDHVVDDMLRDGVRLAREVISNEDSGKEHKRWVVGSIGCYGAALADGSEYRGNYGVSRDTLMKFHRRKVEILCSESPDALAFETIPCLGECRSIMALLKEISDYVLLPPVWLSLACQNENQLNDGTALIEALNVIDECDPEGRLVQGYGVNCCSCEYVVPLACAIARHIINPSKQQQQQQQQYPKHHRCLIFYPNSGETWDPIHENWVEATGRTAPESFASVIMDAIRAVDDICSSADIDAGFLRMIVGGCCRTSPETILEIRRRVDHLLCGG